MGENMKEDLLYALYSFPIQEQHVRITLLDWEDTPIKSKEGQIQTLQGITTGGSINLNGDSSVRRTASLTLVAFDDNVKITNVDNSISMNKRIKLEIGLVNPYFGIANEGDMWYEINDQNIVWFKMGIFIITNASVTRNANSWQISVNLKDKMVLLNGEVAGTLTEPITHSPVYNEHIDEQGHAVLETSEVSFITLIETLVSTFGRIHGDIYINNISPKINNIVRWINKDRDIQINPSTHNLTYLKSSSIVNNQNAVNEENSDNLQSSSPSTYTFNDTIGYRYIDYVYPAGQNLVSNPGETIASVLEKIKNTLGGNYEYFFDVDGNFHFQEIQNRKNLGNAVNDIQKAISEDFWWNNNSDLGSVFTFDDTKNLIVSYQNNPQYSKIKNDIAVAGKRDNTVIRYHLVLKNPTIPSNDCGSYSLQPYIRQLDLDGEQLETGIDGQPVTRLQNGGGVSIEITSSTDYRQYLYVMSVVYGDSFFPWSKEILEEWPKIYDVVNNSFKATGSNLGSINWSIDFVDPSLSEKNPFPYLVDEIGLRPAAIKNDGVNCVFQTSAPGLQIIPIGTSTTADERYHAINETDHDWIQVPQEFLANITWGSASSSAHDAVRTLLFEYISMQESISLTSVPVYHLEPNTIITVDDNKSDIHGDYVISTMSIPLTVTGTMTITAKKAISRI